MDNSPWTAEDDAYIVWSFFMQPIAGICDHLGIPNGRSPKFLQQRFFEIMNDDVLMNRVYEYVEGDLVCYKRVKFSPYEEFQVLNAERLLKTTTPTRLIDVFWPCFHATRSGSSIVAHTFLLQNRNIRTFKQIHQSYIKWKDSLVKGTSESELVKLSLTEEDLMPFLKGYVGNESKTAQTFLTVESMIDKVAEGFRPRDYYALGGAGSPFYISKQVAVIGRRAFGNQVDVDLATYKKVSRVHAEISLCSDLNFYIECKGRNIIVNGEVFVTGEFVRLNHGDLIDIGGYACIFVENTELMKQERNSDVDETD